MAKIYPERLPESVLSDPKRKAERRVFDALSGLKSPYVIFYSVAWQARQEGKIRDGEADFVIAHPDHGLLVMEVKGGGIAFDASTGKWTTTDRYGETFEIDPVEQARTNHHKLLEKLRDLPEWDKRRFLTIGHIVCFPDVSVKEKTLKPDLSREIIIDHKDLNQLERSLECAFDYYADKNRFTPLGKDRLSIVESLLGNSFSLKTPLGIELELEDERLIELTEQQLFIIDILRTRRRAAIAGCAGSGKTMLAVEKARRLHEQGFDVLLTCFNSALAEDLAKRLPDISILHFHGLCRELAQQAGFGIQSVKDEKEYNEVILPEMLMNAVDKTGPLFDAIIVDEGQDFRDTYWVALTSLLKEKDGIFYIFYDDNQNLYGGFAAMNEIIRDSPFPLSVNCRNTQSIHKVVKTFYSQPSEISCHGPIGRLPEIQIYQDSGDMLRRLQSNLNRLVYQESIATDDIVILTPHAAERSALRVGTRLGNFVLTSSPPRGAHQIQLTTIHRFKGLERRVVLLAEIDQDLAYKPEMLLYVGSSRARTHLVFFVRHNAPEEIRGQLETACRPIPEVRKH